jgi:hypothetical protein
MQYVNDDMDELFRRAAENYPLDTSGANWNKVLALMEGETGEKTVSEKKQNNNRRFLWLLLLLPLGLVCNHLYTPGFLNSNSEQSAGETEAKGAIKGSISESLNSDSKVIPVEDQASEGHSVKEGTALPTKQNGSLNKDLVFSGVQVDKAKHGANAAQSRKSFKTSYTYPDGRESFNQLTGETKKIDKDVSGDAALYDRAYVYSISDRERELNPNTIAADRIATSPFDRSSIEGKIVDISVLKPKRFYVGLMAGLDATTIKLQKIENAGFSYGVLAGYELNRKWSIEAGAYLERKYYYSDGKYFNTSKIYMPANSRISEVSGNCKMIEVPISARYVFSSQKGSKWFSTLGLSSYFMTQENYTYDYYYGTVGPVSHKKQYTNGSTNIFSNISLSAGYIRPLGNFADLRIEPYFKVPMSGLGVGSLPLFSMGLQVGITRKF